MNVNNANSVKTRVNQIQNFDSLEFLWCNRTKPKWYTMYIHTHSITCLSMHVHIHAVEGMPSPTPFTAWPAFRYFTNITNYSLTLKFSVLGVYLTPFLVLKILLEEFGCLFYCLVMRFFKEVTHGVLLCHIGKEVLLCCFEKLQWLRTQPWHLTDKPTFVVLLRQPMHIWPRYWHLGKKPKPCLVTVVASSQT